ncbi:hypothetical protein M8J77_001934 [Diaphorina citri]|nr:hypothetical protein M8J77_001934 [Diaphorina citri]
MRWKEASTVIIAAKSKTSEQFQILSLQRSEKSSFLPNVHVFPGGLVDEADSSTEWLKVFKFNFHNLVNLERIEFNLANPLRQNSNVYKLMYQNHTDSQNFVNLTDLNQRPLSQLNLQNKVLPKFISLRITAIRETFEECGILLCKPNRSDASNNDNQDKNIDKDSSSSSSHKTPESTKTVNISSPHNTPSQSQNYMKSYFQFEELTAWRKRVYNNPMEFVNLCLLLDCHPDLNNVKIWSNWLTPGNQYLSTRYDSKFFLVMFNDTDLPKCDIDYCEMKSLQWCTPEQLIKDSMEGKLWLPPPQFYECSRLLNFRTLAELDSFLSSRNSKQCEQWLPVRVKAKDGEIGLLPGDWMYPPNGVDITSTDYYKDHSDLTMSELQHYGHQHEDTSKLPIHRMQYRGPFAFELVVQNIQSSSSHSVAFSRGRHMYNLPSSEHTSKL